MDWKQYFRNIAQQIKLKSKDINTKQGAVIVGLDNEIISTGYNSFPRGINDNLIERQQRPNKYYYFEHAERNSIYNAARIGVSLKNSTMYLTCGIPCADCARGIINSGIIKIVCECDDSKINTGSKLTIWEDHKEHSLQMFKEAGILIEYYDD